MTMTMTHRRTYAQPKRVGTTKFPCIVCGCMLINTHQSGHFLKGNVMFPCIVCGCMLINTHQSGHFLKGNVMFPCIVCGCMLINTHQSGHFLKGNDRYLGRTDCSLLGYQIYGGAGVSSLIGK